MHRLLPVGLLQALLPLASAFAFVVQTDRTPAGQPIQLHWPEHAARTGIPFWIDSRGSRSISDRAATFAAIRAGFKAWESVSVTSVRFLDKGTLDAPAVGSRDRQNVITFDETGTQIGAPSSAGVIAVTRVNSDNRTGEILDADLVFNGRDFRFVVGDPASIRSPSVDLQATATHEIGHVLGLDHTGLTGTPAHRPVMNPYDNTNAAGSGRALKTDDLAGVGSLYPSTAFAGMGGISGSVKKPDGSGAFGVQVVAYDESGNFAVSGLSGYRAGKGGQGEYALVGLPPGRYTVGIEPLNGQVTRANFGGIFNQVLDTDFSPKFYDSAPDRAQAQVLRSLAGQEVTGVDFSTGRFPPGYPEIQNPALPANSPDSVGPYTVRATILDDVGVLRAGLYYRVGVGAYTPKSMRLGSGGVYAADIPGQTRGTTVEYYLEATDTDGHTSVYPTGSDPPLRMKVLDLTGKPLVYVALRSANAVSVLDTGAETAAMEVARIPVGEDPIGTAITPDEKTVCVSNSAGNTVTLIETATHRILASVPVGSAPVDLAPSPDGRLLYVNNTTGNSVSVIDLAAQKQTGRITVRGTSSGSAAPGPYGIAVSPDGKRLYVTMMNDNVVVVLNPATGLELSRIPVVAQPRSLALSPDGTRLYVTGLADGVGVSVVSTVSNQVEATVPTGASARPFSAAVSPDGKTVYVSDYTNHLIVIDAVANRVRQTISIPGENTRGVAVSADGSAVYVSNQDSGDLMVLDPATGRILRTVLISQGARGMAFRNRPIPIYTLEAVLSADFSGDGVVDLDDFFPFAAAFGTSKTRTGYDVRFDLNRDGEIGFPDFFLFADQFGRTTR